MDKNLEIMDLMESFDAYVTGEEVAASSESAAPATTLPCASASSMPCFNSALWTLRFTC